MTDAEALYGRAKQCRLMAKDYSPDMRADLYALALEYERQARHSAGEYGYPAKGRPVLAPF